ncbi:porin [Pasteurellaceae bacterium 15-036681]|nr:porin [Pasteurellaceae bacterium 15-036681]
MKKTLLALTVAAVAATSAHAYTVVDYKDTGTKLDFSGSARVTWDSTSEKNSQKKEHVNHAVSNNGSRFGFRLTQDLGNDFYALGRVEWRFRGTSSSQHDFDDIYTRQLYAGIGHKQYGELTYGNQVVITDEVKRSDLPNKLSLTDGLVNTSARRSLQYVYNGIEGLKVGAYYGGSSKRGNTGLDLAENREKVWGAGAIYNYKIDDVQSIELSTGFTRELFKTSNETAYIAGAAYTYDKTTVGFDVARKTAKVLDSKTVNKEFTAVVYQELTDRLRAYTQYSYKTEKATDEAKATTHEYLIGSEYQLVSKADNPYVTAKTFVEASTSRTKVSGEKDRNNHVAIGLRVYW